MGRGMDKGNTGYQNKPKLSTKDKKLKKMQKKMAKQQAMADIITPPAPK